MNECPIDFLNSKKDALSGLLSSKIDEFKNIKVIASLHVEFVKPLTGVTTQPYMNSSTHVLFNEDEIDEAVHDIIDEFNQWIANYQCEGSGWVFKEIIDFDVSVHKHMPRSVEFNFFINCDRQKRFSQNERRRTYLQMVASDFFNFCLGT